tara:strand:- start:4427 stop:4627 length:201 start_codon:yes stop_codon:yes gene_type:complete
MNKNQIAALNELVGQCRRLELEFDLEVPEIIAVTQALPLLLVLGAQGFIEAMDQFDNLGNGHEEDS